MRVSPPGARLKAVLVIGAIGFLYGFATSWIPSPNDVSVFWIGNFCAPWLVLAFLAGHRQSSWRPGAAAGMLIDVACVVGFYARGLTFHRYSWGLPESTPVVTLAVTSLGYWLYNMRFWLLAAMVGGATYGALGFSWRRRRALFAGLAIAVPFLAEPVLWPLRNGYYQGPWMLWAIEVAIGLVIIGVIVRYWRRLRIASRLA